MTSFRTPSESLLWENECLPPLHLIVPEKTIIIYKVSKRYLKGNKVEQFYAMGNTQELCQQRQWKKMS